MGQHCSDGRACSFPNLDLHMLVTPIFKIPWHQIMASTHWILASCFDPAYGWKCKTINSEASIMFVRIHCLGSVQYLHMSTILPHVVNHWAPSNLMGQLQQSQADFDQKIVSNIFRPHFAPSTGYPEVSLPRQNGHHQYSHRAVRGSPQRSERSGSVLRCGWGKIPISNDHPAYPLVN